MNLNMTPLNSQNIDPWIFENLLNGLLGNNTNTEPNTPSSFACPEWLKRSSNLSSTLWLAHNNKSMVPQDKNANVYSSLGTLGTPCFSDALTIGAAFLLPLSALSFLFLFKSRRTPVALTPIQDTLQIAQLLHGQRADLDHLSSQLKPLLGQGVTKTIHTPDAVSLTSKNRTLHFVRYPRNTGKGLNTIAVVDTQGEETRLNLLVERKGLFSSRLERVDGYDFKVENPDHSFSTAQAGSDYLWNQRRVY